MQEPQESTWEEDSEEPIEEPVAEEFNFYDLGPDSDIDLVSSQIEEKYGFTPSDEYVIDLIAFVRDMINGTVNAA